MTILMMRQYMTIAVLSVLVCTLWIVRSNMPTVRQPALHIEWHHPPRTLWHLHSLKASAPKVVDKDTASSIAVVAVRDLNALALHSIERQYTYVFTGKVLCGEGPCHTAEVQASLASKRNSDVHETASVQPDGSYSLKVSFTELPKEELDWKLTAFSGRHLSSEVDGQHILTEQEPTVVVEKSINL